MRINVKVYGTLGSRFPGYLHSEGMELELRDGATVKDLLAVLEIPESLKVAVTVEGRVQNREDRLRPGVQAHVFNPIHGG